MGEGGCGINIPLKCYWKNYNRHYVRVGEDG